METDVSKLNLRLLRQLPAFIAAYELRSISVWLKKGPADNGRYAISYDYIGDYRALTNTGGTLTGPDNLSNSSYYIFHYPDFGIVRLYLDSALTPVGEERLASMKSNLHELLMAVSA
jgi:hypothetical protein